MGKTSQHNRIKILLIKKRLNQTEIARRLGTTPQKISDVIAGRRKGMNLRPLMAEILGTSIEKLFG